MKVKVHVEGGGPVNFAKKICPEKGFRDASCMFKRLPRSDPWFSGVIWQVVSESSYEVLLANMGPAKDKHGVRESFAKVKCLFAKNGRSGIKEFWSTTIYIYTYLHIYIYTYLHIYIYLFIYNMILALVAGQYDNRSSESSESTEAQDPSEISLPRFFWKWKALKCGQTTSTQWMFVCIYIYHTSGCFEPCSIVFKHLHSGPWAAIEGW